MVVLTYENDEEQVIPLYNDDYGHSPFLNFKITKESLKTKETLEHFLRKQKDENKLNAKKIEIIDHSVEVEKVKSKFENDPIYVQSYNFFKYRIVAKILTIKEKYKMNLRSRKNRKKNK